MELSEHDLDYVIRTNPGDFAIYRLKDGALATIYVSPGVPTLSGMTEAAYRTFMEQDAARAVLEQDRPAVAEKLAALSAGTPEVELTFRILHATRLFVWIHAKARLVGTQNGSPVIITAFLDTSAESAELASLLDHSGGKIYVVERSSYELLYANEPALQAWGRGAFCGQPCYDFIAGRQAPCPWCALRNMKDGTVHEDENYSAAADRWYRIDGCEMNWFGHDAVALYIVDITEQKMQRQGLEIDRMDLEKIIGNVPVGVGVCQVRNGTYTQIAMNPYIHELLGVTPESFSTADTALFEKVWPDDRPGAEESIHRLAEPNARFEYAFRFLRENRKEYRWLRLAARTVPQGESVIAFACLMDVTAEKEAEVSIQQSRRMYESAVETAQLSVWEYDVQNHRILLMDSGLARGDCEKFGIPKVIENIPASCAEWVDDRDFNALAEMYEKIAKGAPTVSCEYWHRLKPGEEPRCERITYTTVFDESGRPVTAYGIGQNITAQKLEQEKYDRFVRDFIETNTRALCTFRLNLTKNWCGDGQSADPALLALQESGTADGLLEAVAARIADESLRAEYVPRFSRARLLEALRAGQDRFTIEYPTEAEPGGRRWVSTFFDLVQNPATGDIEAVTSTFDITERKKEEAIIQRVTNEKCDYIGLVDLEAYTFEFRNINRVVQDLPVKKKMDYRSCIQYDIAHYVDEGDQALFAECSSISNLKEKLAAAPDYVFTYLHNENGGRRRKQRQYSYLDKTAREILVIQTDVTAAYEQEQKQLFAMEKALRAAEAANEARPAFFSRISHDSQTLINSISSVTDLAFKDINDREKLLKDLKRVQSLNTFLLSLMNDSLDISEIDSGKIELHPEPYPYDEYIAVIRGMVEPLCRRKGVTFSVIDCGCEETIVVDRIRFNQICRNLLSNAVKFTPPGGRVTYLSDSRRMSNGLINCGFEVRDTGIGMSEAFQKEMFEPFTQESCATGQPMKEAGTGLGLFVVKRIVDLMKGTITVKSAPGEGTEIAVRFILPTAKTAAGTPAKKRFAPLPGLTQKPFPSSQ